MAKSAAQTRAREIERETLGTWCSSRSVGREHGSRSRRSVVRSFQGICAAGGPSIDRRGFIGAPPSRVLSLSLSLSLSLPPSLSLCHPRSRAPLSLVGETSTHVHAFLKYVLHVTCWYFALFSVCPLLVLGTFCVLLACSGAFLPTVCHYDQSINQCVSGEFLSA